MQADPFSVRVQRRAGAAALAASSREPQRDAALLLGHVLRRERAWLLANSDVLLTAAEAERYEGLLARRAGHEPVQYILGEQEFYGLRFVVTPDVLIPRPETEHLVEAVLERMPRDREMRIADVGTGSGAIAVAIAHARPLVDLVAIDVSLSALQIARANAEANGVDGRVRFLESDLLGGLAGERFEMIVSNPPYIPDGEVLEAQVRDWEPSLALYGGQRGTAVYERLIPQAREALAPGGWLLLEIGCGQQAALEAMLAEWRDVTFVTDLQGVARVAIARGA